MKGAVKEYMTRRGDGLITYTAGGARHWREKGMPADRVSRFLTPSMWEVLGEAGGAISLSQQGYKSAT